MNIQPPAESPVGDTVTLTREEYRNLLQLALYNTAAWNKLAQIAQAAIGHAAVLQEDIELLDKEIES